MLLAAVLLSSESVFAQSGNNNPLRGDVNGDGTVDVADITAVIQIIMNTQEHYFYLGTIKPTAENYKIIPGSMTTYTTIDDAVGATASVEGGQTLYMLCPAEWMAGKTVAVEDHSGKIVNFSEDIDATTILGYVIYKTQVWNEPSTITLNKTTYDIYYGYITVPDNISFGTKVTKTSNSDLFGKYTITVPDRYSEQGAYLYFQIPNNWVINKVSLDGWGTPEIPMLRTAPINGVVYYKSTAEPFVPDTYTLIVE